MGLRNVAEIKMTMTMTKFNKNNNFFVITGGPGVGKTSLLQELKKRKFQVIFEIAREIIKEQKRINGDALPWKNKELYKNIMFDRSIKSFEQIDKKVNNSTLFFFDRGFLDTICYASLIESEISTQMKSYAENWRYNQNVFILPPWQEIYKTDNERKQDWNEAVSTYNKMVETYQAYGYNLVEIPKTPVIERANFILDFIAKNKN